MKLFKHSQVFDGIHTRTYSREDNTSHAIYHSGQKTTWFGYLTGSKRGGDQQEPTHAPFASNELTDTCSLACNSLSDDPSTDEPRTAGVSVLASLYASPQREACNESNLNELPVQVFVHVAP